MRQCMDSDNLHRRLKKIIGQVQAIDRMIDEDIPCEEILSQINAAKSALNGCGKVVLEGHIKHCVRDGIEHGDADKPLKALQRQWSALPTCNDVGAQRLKIQRNLTSYTNIQSQSIQGWLFCMQKEPYSLDAFYNLLLRQHIPL